MSELLSIGDFSRICWLSVKALRLYDEYGLLHPAYVDPATHYRYYVADQARIARAIAILRSLDMPLVDIKELVTESDPDKVRTRLDAHRTVLEERIDRHLHMLRRVEAFIRKGAILTYDMKTRDVDPVDVIGLTLQTSPESIGADAPRAYGRLYEGLARDGLEPTGPPRLVYHDMADDNWTIEACVPVAVAAGAPEGLELRRFDGGKAASARHVGPYDELGMAYRELEVWIRKQGLTPAGPAFDVYLNDPSEVEDPARYETEIVWPVA
jgi:DNA-binding transcriptional MerR regulator